MSFYFAQRRKGGLIKIGYSRNVKPRVHLSRTEIAAKKRFVRAVDALLLDFDAEQVGRIADHVSEYGTDGDGGAREDAVVLECLRVVVRQPREAAMKIPNTSVESSLKWIAARAWHDRTNPDVEYLVREQVGSDAGGWRYVNCNIWNKGMAHVAGNVNTQKIRRFPVVTEVCVQYVFDARVDGRPLKRWLLDEWKRAGLRAREANAACGVKDAATRKYLDQGHLWYFPPPDAMRGLVEYANKRGLPVGRPYFSLDGIRPITPEQWSDMRSRFHCPHGVTNVWDRHAVRGGERVTTGGTSGRAVHLNQKPLDLMVRIIGASTNVGETVWEPFGGLFSASLAARGLRRHSCGAEIDSTYFQYGTQRFVESQLPLLTEREAI